MNKLAVAMAGMIVMSFVPANAMPLAPVGIAGPTTSLVQIKDEKTQHKKMGHMSKGMKGHKGMKSMKDTDGMKSMDGMKGDKMKGMKGM